MENYWSFQTSVKSDNKLIRTKGKYIEKRAGGNFIRGMSRGMVGNEKWVDNKWAENAKDKESNSFQYQ